MQPARLLPLRRLEFRSSQPAAIKPPLDESTSSYHPQTSRVLVLRCNKSRGRRNLPGVVTRALQNQTDEGCCAPNDFSRRAFAVTAATLKVSTSCINGLHTVVSLRTCFVTCREMCGDSVLSPAEPHARLHICNLETELK